jgi:hypothetical protein
VRCLSTWLWEEIQFAIDKGCSTVSVKVAKERYAYFGGVARQVLSENSVDKLSLDARITDAANKHLWLHVGALQRSNAISHRVLHMHPHPENPFYILRLASQAVLEKLTTVNDAIAREGVKAFMSADRSSGSTAGAASCGVYFERLVHAALCDRKKFAVGVIGELAKRRRRPFGHGHKPVHEHFFDSAAPSALQHIPLNTYCRSAAPNFPVLDGIYIPKKCSAVKPVLAFQMTTTQRHGISYTSCVEILKALDARADIDKSQGVVHVHLYFVTPVYAGDTPTVYNAQPFHFPPQNDGGAVKAAKLALQQAKNAGVHADVTRRQLELAKLVRAQRKERKDEQTAMLLASGISTRVHQMHMLYSVESALLSLRA